LQEIVLWVFLVVLGAENNMSKVVNNYSIRKGNMTQYKMAAI